MKRFCISLLAFLPFLVLVYTAFLYIESYVVPPVATPNILNKALVGQTQTRLKEAKGFGAVDILFLGSSHAYRGFDSRIFDKAGFRSFDLGTSAQTPLQTQILLRRYLRGLNPKLIVYEVFPTTFAIDGVESFVDILANDYMDLNAFKLAMEMHNMKLYNTMLYQFLSDPLHKDLQLEQPKHIGEDTYISGGYVQKEISRFKFVSHPQQIWDFKDEQFKAFEETLDFIKQHNTKIILVFAPITSSLYNSYTNNKLFNDKMDGYGEYYNFNELVTLDDSLHFLDEHHLNQDGVKLFDEKLIEILTKKGEMY